ncbi:hypothetical protein [Consotaella aegiceratis]|uniref:hypothetical protein n=1 Tax=Consotaella aegiceratis TaxID=3097961 RepID=UPI002F40F2EF
MILLGLDPAQSTGFAYYEDERSISAITAGVIRAEGDCYEEKSASIARKLIAMCREKRPDLIAIEAPLRQKAPIKRKMQFMGEHIEEEAPTDFGGLNAIISSNQITGAIVAVAGIKAIPFVLISSSTWRRSFLGFGRKPGWQRKDWKKAVREQCARERIAVTNDDMADAVAIAIAAKNTDLYRMLKHNMEKAA